MRVGAILGGSLAAVLGIVALFSACSSVTHEKRPGPPASGAKSAAVHTSSARAASSEVADAGPLDADAPATASVPHDCKDPQVAILNHPDGGIVFNNAMTSADAGFIDRSQALLDVLGQQAHAFRCCFDPWVRAHVDEVGTMLLRLTLAPDGGVVKADIDPERSDFEDEPTRACLLGVARSATYPPSPTARETTLEYPLRVGAMGR